MYFIPICDPDNDRPVEAVETPGSTAAALVNTTAFQREHNRNSTYAGYDQGDLVKRATAILQVQAYQLYQWCVLRARIEHPYRLKHLHFACSKVLPWNFVVEDTDVQLYLQNPRFLWRFSLNNYEYFYQLLCKGIDRRHGYEVGFVDELLTYDRDTSQLVPYYVTHCGALESFVRNVLRRPPKECSKWYRMYDFGELLKDASYYGLDEYEKTEFRHSYDYYLQLIEPGTDYDTFVRILVTGHTLHDAGPLLKLVLEKERALQEDPVQDDAGERHKHIACV